MIVLPLTVYVGLSFYTPTYTATVKMGISGLKPTGTDYYKGIGEQLETLLRTSAEIATSDSIVERTVRVLGLQNVPVDYEKRFAPRIKRFLINKKTKSLEIQLGKLTPERKQALLYRNAVKDLKKKIKAEFIKGTNMFSITVTNFSPYGAVVIANVVSRIYLIYDLERLIAEFSLQYGEKHPLTLQVKDKISELQKSLDGRPLTDLEALGPASVKIVEQAKDATPVEQKDKWMLTVLTFFFSIILGAVFAAGLEYLDQSFRSPMDIETELNAPYLGSIPRLKKKSKDKLLIKDINAVSEYTQAYRQLSERIYLLMKEKGLRSILITDAEASDGTAAIVINTAVYLSGSIGQKVLIIDANFRSPLISKFLNIPEGPGFTDVLNGEISLEAAIHNTGSQLFVLPVGKDITSQFLNFAKVSELIKTAEEKYDAVFVTCADLKNFNDAVVLASIVSGVVFVVNEGKARRLVIKNVIMPLHENKLHLLGGILNNRKFPIPNAIYRSL